MLHTVSMRKDQQLAVVAGMAVFIALCVVCPRDIDSVKSFITGNSMIAMYSVALIYFGVHAWRNRNEQ